MGAMASQITSPTIVYSPIQSNSTVCLFRCRSKKISKLCVTGLCAGNSPVTGEFPAQMASNAENASIWWRHHAIVPVLCNHLFLSLIPVWWSLWNPGVHVIPTSSSTGAPGVVIMMTSSNENIFRVTGPLCGEFTGHRWIPLTKASGAELWCFLWSAHE